MIGTNKLYKGCIKCSALAVVAAALVATGYSTTKLITKEANASSALLLSKYEGYTLRFNAVEGATSYEVYDDNDYRESITLSPSDAISGYLYYTTEVVGPHSVYVKANTSSGTIKSNTIKAVENKPVFDYSIGTPVFFYDTRDGTNSNYTVIKDDGTIEYVPVSTFNSNYIYSRNGTMDFTTTTIEKYKIGTILDELKAMGSNVVKLDNRFFDIETGSQWWWNGSFDNSVCKRIMNAAWERGMKCIVSDFAILTNSESDNGPSTASSRIVSTDFKKAAKHPAFYGIELNDEPLEIINGGSTKTQVENSGLTAKAILTAWHSDTDLSKLPDPYIHTDLASYNDIADGYFDDGPESYQSYLESWLTYSGLNHLDFDYYTYTAYEYGTKKIGSTTYHYDSTKVIYDCINNLRATHPGLVVSQTLPRTNAVSRNDITYKEVYASTFLAASQGCNGYSTYTFAPSSYSQENSPFDYNFETTSTYALAQGAAEQYKKIQGILDGYTFVSNEITNYYKKYLTNYHYGYGEDARTSTSIFRDFNLNECKMVVNFNTSSSNTTAKVTVPKGKTYHLFGNGVDTSARTGAGSDVTLNNGEAIIIIDFVESPVNGVSKSVILGYRCQFKGNKFIQGSDKFVVKVAVDNSALTSKTTAYDSHGIYVETSSKAHHFTTSECSLENNGASLYVVINLGSVLTNENTQDVFTLKVFAKTGDDYIYSSDNIQFSVASLVQSLYNDIDTRSSVLTIYNYMLNRGVL